MQQPNQVKEPHLLAIKVMRLSKPAPVVDLPMCLNEKSYFDEKLREDVAGDFPLSDLLSVPHQFGNIYLGEKFISYIRVSNDSNSSAIEVSVKAELQTNTRRVQLSDPANCSKQILEPAQSIDFIVNHEVKELGKHTLVISVNYTRPNHEKAFFRKSFKFLISNPLAVKTKVYNIEDVVFLEAQVQNLINVPMLLEKIQFDAHDHFRFTDLNSFKEPVKDYNECDKRLIPDIGCNTKSTFGGASYMAPQDVRQYLYRLDPIDKDKAAPTTVGKIDITWRTTMGEFGRLQTSQLPRKVVPRNELRVEANSPTERVVINVPFTLNCTVSNIGNRKMSLRVFSVKSRKSQILLNGISGHYLGEFPPGSSKTFELSLFPVANGVYPVSGLRIADDVTQRVFDIEKLKDIFVHSS